LQIGSGKSFDFYESSLEASGPVAGATLGVGHCDNLDFAGLFAKDYRKGEPVQDFSASGKGMNRKGLRASLNGDIGFLNFI
jgi:hypothetical protein